MGQCTISNVMERQKPAPPRCLSASSGKQAQLERHVYMINVPFNDCHDCFFFCRLAHKFYNNAILHLRWLLVFGFGTLAAQTSATSWCNANRISRFQAKLCCFEYFTYKQSMYEDFVFHASLAIIEIIQAYSRRVGALDVKNVEKVSIEY